MDVLQSDDIVPTHIHSHLESWWKMWEGEYAVACEQLDCAISAIVAAKSLYASIPGATIDPGILKLPLYAPSWAQSHRTKIQVTRKPELDLGEAFACLAMFESGEFDIDQSTLQGVMALSTGDSIFVASSLLADPSKCTTASPIRRVLGNLGRPEMAFLIPPPRPALAAYNPSSWQLVNHFPFDRKFQDNFSDTPLHLSFTDFEMPIDVGVRGLRDTQAVLVETLVSINHRGKHLGDLDILSMFNNELLTIQHQCLHRSLADRDTQTVLDAEELALCLSSLDCWEEFFDPPLKTGIFRATGNWQARLAAAAASVQQGKRTFVLPEKPCAVCLGDSDNIGSMDIIVS
ncbi:hypothetical protein BJX64DRAFT_295611 [Aspergillus heterothallicus]